MGSVSNQADRERNRRYVLLHTAGCSVINDDPKTERNDRRVTLTCACSRCDNVMELQIAIERFAEQPA